MRETGRKTGLVHLRSKFLSQGTCEKVRHSWGGKGKKKRVGSRKRRACQVAKPVRRAHSQYPQKGGELREGSIDTSRWGGEGKKKNSKGEAVGEKKAGR